MKIGLRKTIFWQIRKLRMTEDERHAMTESVVGKSSLTKCSDKDAMKIIDHLSELGAAPVKKKSQRAKVRRQLKPEAGGVTHLITAGQRKTIEDILEWNSDAIEDPEALLKGVSNRVCGRDYPSTVKEAQAVISALNTAIKYYRNREEKHAIQT